MIELALAASNHLTEGNFNEVHPAIRVWKEDFFIGAYHNSENNLSFMGGYHTSVGSLFLDAALVTGYDYAPVLPMIRAGFEFDNVRLWVAPSATPDGEVFGIVGMEVYFTYD